MLLPWQLKKKYSPLAFEPGTTIMDHVEMYFKWKLAVQKTCSITHEISKYVGRNRGICQNWEGSIYTSVCCYSNSQS